MSMQFTSSILSQVSPTEAQPSDPGGPNYIGSIDYPTTVYQGYIGSINYTYEPNSIGFGTFDTSNMADPVAKMPSTDQYNRLNRYNKMENFTWCPRDTSTNTSIIMYLLITVIICIIVICI